MKIEVVEISAGCFFDDHLLHSNFRISFLWEEIKIMKITCKEVAQKLIDYLHHRITLADLVDWAEDAMMEANFNSNVDPDDAASVLEKANLESTLFILVSKSGTTQETLANRDLAIKWMGKKNPDLIPSKHMIAVTSATSPLASSDAFLDSFYIDDFIGGRYSSTSAVGGAVLTLAFGKDVFKEFLNGAAESDKNALNDDISYP